MKFDQSPVALLHQIAQASASVERDVINAQDMTASWSGIGFSLCGQRMIAPMGEVVEIVNVPPITYVPRVKDWLLGIANVRGRLLPIIDLERYFGARLAGNKNRHRALIIDVDGIYAGLVVSNVFGLKHFMSDAFDEGFERSGELFEGCIDARGVENGTQWFRFQPHLLTAESAFRDPSSLQESSNDSLAGGSAA